MNIADFFRFDSENLIHTFFIDDRQVLENFQVYLPHKLDFYLIRIIKKGSGVLSKNHIPISFEERSVILSAPGDVLFVESAQSKNIEVSIIAFSESFVNYLNIEAEMIGFVEKLNSETHLTFDKENFSYLTRLADLIEEENMKNPGGTKDKMIAKLVETFLYFIVREYKITKLEMTATRNYINMYKDFLNLVDQHIKKLHFVADYVDLMQMNEKTLNRVCKKVTGFTALQIIHKQLDEEIKRLLYYSAQSNKEISRVMGFNDTTHLYKFFKKMNGITPKQYKANAQKIW